MSQTEIMSIVNNICNMESTDCRSLNKSQEARLLLDLLDIPKAATISEIPVDWDSAVEILFYLPNDKNYYSIFAGIGNDDKFYCELAIDGVFTDDSMVDFYDQNKVIKTYCG